MMKNIPVGVSDFARIRENGYYYVDKSGLIQELLRTEAVQVTLITRPRRFGKTLGMSMLYEFFSIEKESRELFQDLEIGKQTELCEKWMNQWPVLFFSLKDVRGLDYESAYGMLRNVIGDLCSAHAYLLDSPAVSAFDKKALMQLADTVDGRVSAEQLKRSIALLMRMMQAYYGKKVILLIDEYDVPVAKASSNAYDREMLELISVMLSSALKDNPSLQFAVVTGCLRIAKESIFTGTNNFVSDTISDNRYNEYFGFTEKEVRAFLQEMDCTAYAEQVRKWYDGYHFGDVDVYCPWDVLNYIYKLRTEGAVKPANFWEHTSDNAIIGSFLERTEFELTEKFEKLLGGGYIKEYITENLTYDVLRASEENLWALLYLTGYLTKVRQEELEPGDTTDEKQAALKIPNAEIMDIFQRSVIQRFYHKSAGSDRSNMFAALWNGDEKGLTQQLSDLLFDTISFHDYKESFYHAFITGLFSGAGYVVESNYENGLGRSDVVVKDRKNRRAVVIEAKAAVSEGQMETECRNALKQIRDQQYARKIERSGFTAVISYGIAFFQKKCLVLKGE